MKLKAGEARAQLDIIECRQIVLGLLLANAIFSLLLDRLFLSI